MVWTRTAARSSVLLHTANLRQYSCKYAPKSPQHSNHGTGQYHYIVIDVASDVAVLHGLLLLWCRVLQDVSA